jgi:hypothetical protein
MHINQNESVSGYDHTITVSEHETLCLKRLGDNTVQVLLDDVLTGTTVRLAYYKNGTWRAYNAPNFERMFHLFRTHKHLRPKLHKFLSLCTPDYPQFSTEMQKVFTFARKKVIVTVKTAHRSMTKMLTL